MVEFESSNFKITFPFGTKAAMLRIFNRLNLEDCYKKML